MNNSKPQEVQPSSTVQNEPCEWNGRILSPHHDLVDTADGHKRCANCKKEWLGAIAEIGSTVQGGDPSFMELQYKQAALNEAWQGQLDTEDEHESVFTAGFNAAWEYLRDLRTGFSFAAQEGREVVEPKPADGWISVKDRMPDEAKSVLVFVSNDDQGYYVAALYGERWNDESTGSEVDDGYADPDTEVDRCVTHWQFLTQPLEATR